jgi:hypothetical protein
MAKQANVMKERDEELKKVSLLNSQECAMEYSMITKLIVVDNEHLSAIGNKEPRCND